jgi:hypothetical protein
MEELLGGSDNGLAVGQLRRQRKLGSAAVYRVCACEGDYVQVEVVTAPGLREGQHFKFSRAAVELMELVADDDPVRTLTPRRRAPARSR